VGPGGAARPDAQLTAHAAWGTPPPRLGHERFNTSDTGLSRTWAAAAPHAPGGRCLTASSHCCLTVSSRLRRPPEGRGALPALWRRRIAAPRARVPRGGFDQDLRVCEVRQHAGGVSGAGGLAWASEHQPAVARASSAQAHCRWPRRRGAALPPSAPRACLALPPLQQALAAIQGLNQTPAGGGQGLLEVKFADADAGDRNPQLSAPPSDNLYCKNLPGTFTDDELRALFAQHGRVVECKLLHRGDPAQVRERLPGAVNGGGAGGGGRPGGG
jgi:hypothetical protein